MLRRGVAVLLVVGAMVAWSAQPAAAESPLATNLYLTVCTTPASCQVIPVKQTYNSTLDTVLSTYVDNEAYTALGACRLVKQENIALPNGGKLSVCPAPQQYERRSDFLRYVDSGGNTYAVSMNDYSDHLCLHGTGYGVYSGDASAAKPVVELRHEEYPCTV